jgi:hypothetical protein
MKYTRLLLIIGLFVAFTGNMIAQYHPDFSIIKQVKASPVKSQG